MQLFQAPLVCEEQAPGIMLPQGGFYMFVMTGANGRLGRLVAGMLAKLGFAHQVTLTTRDPAKIADLTAMGFKTVRADFSDTVSMRAAFYGAKAALMISMPGPVEERIPLHRNAFDAAKEVKLERLVYTSRVHATHDSLYPFAKIHAFSEDYLNSIGITTTISRHNEYVENVVKTINGAKDPSQLILPGAIGKVPYIALADIAEILAKLLVEDGHAGKVYELNGPEAIGRSDIAEIVATASGRATVALPVTREEFGQFMKDQGRPQYIVEMVMGLCDAIDAGEFEKVWPDAPKLLGRPTQSARDFLHKAFAA
jgi:NAD(P)H dehydrogenase (quinone)